MGRLATNVITGEDASHASIKLMGSHKNLSLWTAEDSIGVIILSPPQINPTSPPPQDRSPLK